MATQAASNSTPPPVPTRIAMCDATFIATVPWVNWFTRLGKLYGFNQTIEVDGVALPGQVALNFLAPLTATDNPTDGSTDISLAASAPVARFAIPLGFGDIKQNTGKTPLRVYLTIQTPGSTAGTATVKSDANDPPSATIAQQSVVASGGGGVVQTLNFEVLAGEYYTISQDTGSLSITIADGVQ